MTETAPMLQEHIDSDWEDITLPEQNLQIPPSFAYAREYAAHISTSTAAAVESVRVVILSIYYNINYLLR